MPRICVCHTLELAYCFGLPTCRLGETMGGTDHAMYQNTKSNASLSPGNARRMIRRRTHAATELVPWSIRSQVAASVVHGGHQVVGGRGRALMEKHPRWICCGLGPAPAATVSSGGERTPCRRRGCRPMVALNAWLRRSRLPGAQVARVRECGTLGHSQHDRRHARPSGRSAGRAFRVDRILVCIVVLRGTSAEAL